MTLSTVRTGTQISQELLDKLHAAFPPPRVQHDTPQEQIKWQAAQHEVVQWIEQYVGKKQSVGTADRTPEQAEFVRPKATVRYGA